MDTFLGNTFWTLQYIGVGPYKLERWEPGNFIEGSAFDGHALGRPKIDRFISRPVPDENTAMTNLLAGSADIGLDNALRFEHGIELQRQWGAERGTVLMDAGTRHWIFIQFRPDLLKTTALGDVRVRRALAHATDRDPINQALFEGQGFMSEQWIPPKAPYYDDAERVANKYPFDLRRAEQLLTEAGLTKDAGRADEGRRRLLYDLLGRPLQAGVPHRRLAALRARGEYHPAHVGESRHRHGPENFVGGGVAAELVADHVPRRVCQLDRHPRVGTRCFRRLPDSVGGTQLGRQ